MFVRKWDNSDDPIIWVLVYKTNGESTNEYGNKPEARELTTATSSVPCSAGRHYQYTLIHYDGPIVSEGWIWLNEYFKLVL